MTIGSSRLSITTTMVKFTPDAANVLRRGQYTDKKKFGISNHKNPKQNIIVKRTTAFFIISRGNNNIKYS